VENVLGDSLTFTSLLFLLLALGLALGFEFVNGFHDTANAVATVIYTNSLKPTYAVVWSGLWNLTGVLLSAGTVAFGILALLPVELVINVGSGAGFAMVFSLLISAIIWNVGTWYFGLPASSSHTLIGSIVGVGLANSVMSAGHTFGDGVNWGKVQDTVARARRLAGDRLRVRRGLLLLFKVVVTNRELYAEPDKTEAARAVGARAADPHVHGRQLRARLERRPEGHGADHADPDRRRARRLRARSEHDGKNVAALVAQTRAAAPFHKLAGAIPSRRRRAIRSTRFSRTAARSTPATFPSLDEKNDEIATFSNGKTSLAQVPKDDRKALRSDIYLVSASIAKLKKKKAIANQGRPDGSSTTYHKALDKTTNFIPVWVKVAVALCLGLGTMIGWKRIVVTVGERIGKSHLTYGQGASAEIVAYGTIQSPTSSACRSARRTSCRRASRARWRRTARALQGDTLRNILLAWVLTLPVCVFLGSMLFAFGLRIVAAFGLH
jgi:PiT family inorganic phosphate transporter